MSKLLFQQLFEKESSTYTYLVADSETREALIIDPVIETAERDLKLIMELELKVLFTLETHIHADHITGAWKIAEATGAKIGVSAAAETVGADLKISDGDQLSFGAFSVLALATPGHTSSCVCYFVDDRVFTGDTLLIRGSGRTDFQEGSAATLYKSVQRRLFTLPDETLVYPGHDYRGFTASTIGDEKRHNARLNQKIDESTFFKIMADLKLSEPAKIKVAVPANLNCGRP
jgi:sulfur dioxygenase